MRDIAEFEDTHNLSPKAIRYHTNIQIELLLLLLSLLVHQLKLRSVHKTEK